MLINIIQKIHFILFDLNLNTLDDRILNSLVINTTLNSVDLDKTLNSVDLDNLNILNSVDLDNLDTLNSVDLDQIFNDDFNSFNLNDNSLSWDDDYLKLYKKF